MQLDIYVNYRGNCEEAFRFYEQQHRAKGTPDADAKAEVNRALSEELEAILARATQDTRHDG